MLMYLYRVFNILSRLHVLYNVTDNELGLY